MTVGIILVVGVVLSLAVYRSWCVKCHPSYCSQLQAIQLGLLAALGIIALMKLIGIGEQFSLTIWLMIGLVALLIQILIFTRQCNPCKDCE